MVRAGNTRRSWRHGQLFSTGQTFFDSRQFAFCIDSHKRVTPSGRNGPGDVEFAAGVLFRVTRVLSVLYRVPGLAQFLVPTE